MPIFARGSYLLMGLFALLALGAAGAQDVRLGAALGPGAVVEVPEVERTGGEPTRSGVPTVVVFAQVKDCNLCEAVGHIVSRWTREYPNLQIVVVENRTARDAVEAWSQEHGLPVVPASEPAFRRAFDTNLTAVYLVDERGTVRDKVRPVQRAQWLALDRQLQRADRGDWEAVDANTVALPAVGGVARGSPSVPLGDGTPALVLVGDGFCSWCRQLVADGLKGAVGELRDRWPDLRVYLLEPSLESLGSGFYGSSTYDYGPREDAEAHDRQGRRATTPAVGGGEGAFTVPASQHRVRQQVADLAGLELVAPGAQRVPWPRRVEGDQGCGPRHPVGLG